MPKLAFGGGGSGLLPEGTYSVFATEIEYGVTKNGFDQVRAIWQVAGGVYANRTFLTYFNSGMGSIDSYLAACDIQRDDDGNWNVEDDGSDVIGVLVNANLTHNTNPKDDKTYPNTNDFLPNDPIGARFTGDLSQDDEF